MYQLYLYYAFISIMIDVASIKLKINIIND